MSVLKTHFNPSINQDAPVLPDYDRIVNYDEDGNEFITYELVDYPKFQESLGLFTDWNLNALLKAGINPDFPIHTGAGTRIEGLSALSSIKADVDALLSEDAPKE